MTTQNSEDTPPVEATVVAQQSTPPGLESRRRLRELLSVPERDRSDEQWDEIIELEIQLAPGNRLAAGQDHGSGGGGQSTGGHRSAANPGAGAQQPKKHRPRNSNNRRPRTSKPTGNPA